MTSTKSGRCDPILNAVKECDSKFKSASVTYKQSKVSKQKTRKNLNATRFRSGLTTLELSQNLLANLRLLVDVIAVVALYTVDLKLLLNPSKNDAEKSVINHGAEYMYKANINRMRLVVTKKTGVSHRAKSRVILNRVKIKQLIKKKIKKIKKIIIIND